MPRNTNDDCACYRNPCICNPDDDDAEDDVEEALEPGFQLRADVVQQGLFATSAYEAKPKKKKPAALADARQVDMFGAPITRKNPSASRGDSQALAHEFSRILREWLTEDEIAEVIARNKADRRRRQTAQLADPAVCASHDFCDANMAMYEAFQNIAGHPVDPQNTADVSMWNKAWSMAKASGFDADPQDNPGVFDLGRTDRSALLAAHWTRLSALSPAQRRAAVVDLSRDDALALAEWDATGEYPDPRSRATLTQAHRQLLRQLDAARENPGVVSIAERIRARLESERARRRAQTEDVLDSLGQTMMEDPGFQQEVRRQEATRTMQRHAAGAQLFKERDRVVYARTDGDIPASWRGQIVSHEWHPEWADDGDGHFYNVLWVTPERAKHEGVFHQSDLRSAR